MATDLRVEETSRLRSGQAEQAQRLYRSLHEAIVAGDVPAGTIITSADLALSFQTDSRVVAAALRGLAHEGLISIERGRPKRVLGPPLQTDPGSTADPRVVQVEHTLRERLADLIYKPGQLLPERQDLADELGVPQSVVDAALGPLFIAGYLAHSLLPIGTRVTRLVLESSPV
ncbi:GntR family transcriptional regulator [Streptomyces prunicolor]|uniref:GntR family transcriptional regulator n=1 Tax=Streptomyces prunicolor TaxID=67348 RepID=UPI00035E0585|nr:GntR family transcriptional regulator [Streptomyces prunicolor]